MTQISVCMATYNGAMFISEQIASILPQLGYNDELIISDDGSTDDTLLIINLITDNRIRLFHNRPPRSATRNFENALRHATGEYIFLSDQDDIWYPNKLQISVNFLQKYDLLVSNCDFVDETGRSLGTSFFQNFRSGPGITKNFVKNTYLGNCMAFRRTVLERALPFPNEVHQATHYMIFQDVWIGLLGNVLFKVVFIPEKLSGFRRHTTNASPTEMSIKSPQSLKNKLLGRMLLVIALTKRILNIA